MPGLLGSTILGSGQVILILNIYELLRSSANRTSYASGYVSPTTGRARPDVKAGPELIRRARTTGSLGNSPSEVFRQRRAPLIQVVDDSLSVRKVLSGMLEKSGFRVRTSKDGQEALEIIQQQSPPDLIVMDIEMPRMDGYELTSILKNSPLYQSVPIIMLTSRAGLKHRQKAEEVGADGFLVKPYKEEELLQIVSALLLESHSGSEA
jgi:chemosensory pili system protein ChpA (sensor histidine kinase/response regulator)